MSAIEPAGFPAEELLRLVCERVLADPDLSPRAGPMLERVREALGVGPEAAGRVADELASARGGAAAPAAPERFAADEVYEQACGRAWADGALQRAEVRLLRALGAALGLTPARARAIADRVADPEGADEGPVRGELDPVARLAGGRYRDPVLLGMGGMGAVYRAFDGVLGREVAIKLIRDLPDDPVAGEQIRGRFLREARTLAQLAHPGLPTVHDVGEVPALHIVMELIEGKSLQSLYAAQGPMDPAAVEGFVRQAAAVLGHAHGRGVVHRDVKPDNLMLESGGRIRVVDFGIALVGDATRLTEAGLGIGTLGFLPPEQVSAVGMGPRSDVYALAATAFFLITGKYPYTLPQLAVGRGFDPPPLPPSVPRGLAAAVARGLRLDPGERPACMSELVAMIDGAGLGGPVAGPLLTSFPERLARWHAARIWLDGLAEVLAPLETQGGTVDPVVAAGFARTERESRPGPGPVHPEDRELVDAVEAAWRDLAGLAAAPVAQNVLHLWGSVRLARRRLEDWMARRRVELGQVADAALPFPCTVGAGVGPVVAEDPEDVRAALEGLLQALGEDLVRAGARGARVAIGPGPGGGVAIEVRADRTTPEGPATPAGKWASVGMLSAWCEARRGRLAVREGEGEVAVTLELPGELPRP